MGHLLYSTIDRTIEQMAHLSKNQLSKQELNELFFQLNTLISKLDTKTADQFLGDLLGPEEKIMIVKRLAAIVMFIEGNSSYRVWQLLKLSPSTADRIKLNFDNGKYDRITLILTSDKKIYHSLWKTLEIILQAGLPPRGRGRWKSVFESLETKSN